MQRNLVLLLVAILFLGVVTAVGQAQIDPADQSEDELLIVKNPPKQMIDGVYSQPQGSVGTDALLTPLSLTADDPADSCSEASLLVIDPDNPADGDSADVRKATESPDDPVLSCMWGSPTRPQGYRTVWYKLVPTVSGRVTFSTFSSDYDTVLGVYTGECGSLVSVQCSDDFNGFSSQGAVTVTKGETYYIEVADWSGARSGSQLQFSGLLEPVDSKWVAVTADPGGVAISRHTVVAYGQSVYVFGGQTKKPGEAGLSQISNSLQRFDTSSGKWHELNHIPGAGYSNTTAALLNNQMYVPSGYNGNNYDGQHWVYTIAPEDKGFWAKKDAPVPKVNGANFAWASAAVHPSHFEYYLTGGMTSTQPLTNTAKVSMETFRYQPTNDSWEQLAPMQAGRYAHTAGWMDSHGICVAGGLGVGTDPDTSDPITILHRSAECSWPGGSWYYIGDMNIPRYGAGSVVGPDGKWYVFGGITVDDNQLKAVAQTEVYDPISRTWSLMGPSFNLANFDSMPARFWPRGAMLGNNLWVVGGSIFTEEGEEAAPVIDRLRIPSQTVRLPFVASDYGDAQRLDDTFAQARPVTPGIPQTRNFDQQRDFVDFFTFYLNPGRRVNIHLDVPKNNDFDLFLYDHNKLLWGSSSHPFTGAEENISIVLPAGQYYIAVTRVIPTGQPDKGAYYTLRLD